MAKVLLVDDDRELTEQIKEFLLEEHHIIDIAHTGEEGMSQLLSFAYDLVILDWTLPRMSGLDVLKELRSYNTNIPVLMLTGKDTVVDVEMALDAGADDYLRKPFHVRELIARVKALVRREGAREVSVFKTKTVELDVKRRRVTKAGQEVKLQPQEIALLEFLMRHPQDTFSAEALLNRVWESDLDISADTVRVCVTRLRNKLDTPGSPSVIRTVYRSGYQIDLEQ